MKYLVILLNLFVVLTASNSWAVEYFVNPAGGSSIQCTGMVNSPLSPDRKCAVNHITQLHQVEGGTTKLHSGDVVNVASGSYEFGINAPNRPTSTSVCAPLYPYGCKLKSLPDGVSIIGDPANPPEFWGAERVEHILSLNGSDNIVIKNLIITDHSECIEHKDCNRTTRPYGPWAVNGIVAQDSTNVLLENVSIHGLRRGIKAGRLKDWTLKNVVLRGNASVGWDGDIGSSSSNSGYMKFINSKIEYSGCAERYPDTSKVFNCFGQSQSGYGDGLGTEKTNGDWYFENTEISHNVSDWLYLLYS